MFSKTGELYKRFVLLLGVAGFSLLGFAQDALLVSPHYGIERRDASEKTLPVLPPDETLNFSGITFNLWYADLSLGNGIGFNGPNGVAARERMRDALAYIASVINMPGELDILVESSDPTLYPIGFLASAGTYFPITAGNHRGSTLHRLESGEKLFPGNEEINMKVLFNQNWNFTLNPPTGDQLDFFSIVLHELIHGLGFVSLGGATGESIIATNTYSIFDLIIRHPAAPSELLFDGSNGFLGQLGDITGDELILFGNQTGQSYNRGVFPPVHAPATFQLGTSLSHWSSDRLLGGAAVMEPARLFGTAVRELRPFEAAALRDIGYANVAVTIEIPTAEELLSVSPATRLVSAGAGTTTFTITNIANSPIVWAATESCPMVTGVEPSGGTLAVGGLVTVVVSFGDNTATTSRSCDISISALDVSQPFTLTQSGALDGGSLCLMECINTSPDSDGDGLSDACELCLGTDSLQPDTDGDGMPDGWEYDHGLNPLSPADANTDLDGDGLTNLEEFHIASNPVDPSSPRPTRFVSPNGVDTTSHGDTIDNPWRTIAFALAQVNGPVAIRLAPGVYAEDFFLKEDVTIWGSSCPDGMALSGCAVIEGTVFGANRASLRDIVLTQGAQAAVLLDMESVAMTLTRLRFIGGSSLDGVGVQVRGTAPASSIIEFCTFESLNIGIEIFGAIPKVRRNVFRNHGTAYVVVRDGALAKAFGKGLGDATDSETGFNAFEGPVENTAVINENEAMASMENNYWGTGDAEVASGRIDGPVDFEPFLATANAVLASSILCTVWETGTQKRILNASVALAPSGVKNVTDNNNGVYVFAAVPASTYTVTAIAEGFTAASQTLTVAAGQQSSIILPVSPENMLEGEDGGDDDDPRCGCQQGDNGKAGIAGLANRPADLLVFLLVLWTFACFRKRFNKRCEGI